MHESFNMLQDILSYSNYRKFTPTVKNMMKTRSRFLNLSVNSVYYLKHVLAVVCTSRRCVPKHTKFQEAVNTCSVIKCL